MSNKSYSLRLFGEFELRAPDGNKISISEKKARALIAILATSPQMRRPRTLLRSLLWHRTRSPQDSYSLRQAVYKTRALCTDYPEFLCSDHGSVWLENVTIIHDLNMASYLEFFEDAPNIGGEFETWLTLQRKLHARKQGATVANEVAYDPAPLVDGNNVPHFPLIQTG